MKPPRNHFPSAQGFTLLELLIGVIAFAIVLAAINSVFYGGLRLRNKTTDAVDRSLPQQHALGIMKRDLENIVMPGGTLAGQFQSTPTNSTVRTALASVGEPAGPEFVTASGIVDDTSPWAEFQKVDYYLVAATNGTAPGRDLVRYVTRNLLPVTDDEPARQWLMSGVENVTFYYYDGSSWDDTWDSTTANTKLPAAIKVEIEFATGDNDPLQRPPIELIVPLMVGSGTNQTAQASGTTQ